MEKLISRKRFVIIEIFFVIYTIIALIMSFYIAYFSKMTLLYKIIICYILLSTSAGSIFESYKKYKKEWFDKAIPKVFSKKGFIVIQVLFSSQIDSFLLQKILDIIFIPFDMRFFSYFYSLDHIKSISKIRKYDVKDILKILERLDFKEKFILNIFHNHSISFSILLFKNKGRKYNEIALEIDLDNTILIGVEDYIFRVTNYLSSNLNSIYGRILFSHKRNISNGYYSIEDIFEERISKAEFGNRLDNQEYLISNVPGIYWGNILNKNHIEKLGGIERIRKDFSKYIIRQLDNEGVYIQVSDYVKNYERNLESVMELEKFFINVIDYSIKLEYIRDWAIIVKSLNE